MRIAHFGTFDVQNYGDLLFPGILRHALDAETTLISPLGGQPYRDVPPSTSLESVRREGRRFDAVVLGGGNILHAASSSLPAYRSVRRHGYTNLWVGAAQLAARQDIPLIINAPGVPRRFRGLSRTIIRRIGVQAAYFAVRDDTSRNFLSAAGVHDVRVVPDTALNLSESMPIERLAGERAEDHPAGLEPGEYVAVHVNDRYGRAAPEMATQLDAVSKSLGVPCCLVSIGPCHGDSQYAEEVAALMSSDPVVHSRPLRVATIAAIIAQARLYIGSSMHGFITATSYGVPGLLVAQGSMQHKFNGLLDQLGTSDRLFESWSDAVALLQQPQAGVVDLPADAGNARRELSLHWDSVRAALIGRHGSSVGAVLVGGAQLSRLVTALPRWH